MIVTSDPPEAPSGCGPTSPIRYFPDSIPRPSHVSDLRPL